MKKVLVGAAVCASAILGLSSSSFAGEVTGGPNPKPTPVGSYRAGSICSFSGQNDVPEGDPLIDEETGEVVIDPETGEPVIDPLSVGRVQSWGQTMKIGVSLGFPRVESIHAFGPGVNCHGYASGGGGEP
jgi:hypothetical protein